MVEVVDRAVIRGQAAVQRAQVALAKAGKGNPNHDEKGRFSSGSGGGGQSTSKKEPGYNRKYYVFAGAENQLIPKSVTPGTAKTFVEGWRKENGSKRIFIQAADDDEEVWEYDHPTGKWRSYRDGND